MDVMVTAKIGNITRMGSRYEFPNSFRLLLGALVIQDAGEWNILVREPIARTLWFHANVCDLQICTCAVCTLTQYGRMAEQS